MIGLNSDPLTIIPSLLSLATIVFEGQHLVFNESLLIFTDDIFILLFILTLLLILRHDQDALNDDL